jgi:hypothetical protein
VVVAVVSFDKEKSKAMTGLLFLGVLAALGLLRACGVLR